MSVPVERQEAQGGSGINCHERAAGPAQTRSEAAEETLDGVDQQIVGREQAFQGGWQPDFHRASNFTEVCYHYKLDKRGINPFIPVRP